MLSESVMRRHAIVLSLLVMLCAPAASAATGRLVFVSNRLTHPLQQGKADLFTADDDGANVMRLTGSSYWDSGDADPDWSPDGRQVVFAAYTGDFRARFNFDLFIADGSGVRQITFTPELERDPSWSPDGTHIAFTRSDASVQDIFLVKPDGTGLRKVTDMVARAREVGFPSVPRSPDWLGSNEIVFSMDGDLFTVTTGPAPVLRRVTTTTTETEMFPAGSPDGSRIAYERSDAIWVIDADGRNARKLAVAIGGWAPNRPDWSPDGSRIAYTALDALEMMVGFQIWTMKADGTDKVRVTGGPNQGQNRDPSWVASPSTLSVDAVRPPRGTNNGYATVTVYGTSLDASTTVSMGGIRGEVESVSPAGRWLRARFDLRGAAPGATNIIVSNAAGSSYTLPGAYTIVASARPQGGNAVMWSEVVVRDTLRPGQKANGFITVGNSGSEDGIARIVVTLDDGASLTTDYHHGPLSGDTAGIDFSQIPDKVRVRDAERDKWTTIIPLVMPIAAGESVQLPFVVRMPQPPPGQPCPNVRVNVVVGSVTTDCLLNLADLASGLIPGHECLKGTLWSIVLETMRMKHGTPSTLASFGAELAMSAAKCMLSLIPHSKVILFVIDLYETYSKTWTAADSCSAFASSDAVSCVQSSDPNDKHGASGAGTARWIAGDRAIPYSIFFENKPEATAPAQDVIITDQLDPAKLDLDSFAFGPVWFGDRFAAPAVPSKEFTADVDLRPAKPLIVRVNAKLDTTTALATWKFQSLDPATMKPTTDVFAGFLPPNRNAPEGDGGVSFTIMPRAGLATGATIANGARIVFDLNAPIDTPVWSNRIDRDAPTSMARASTNGGCGSILVSWTGSDAGSGIASYDVYVSKNGGAFTRWLERTTATSASFEGEPSGTYGFYSVAHDAVGHLESAPATADVTVTVTDTVPPLITAPAGLSLTTAANAGACGLTIDDDALGRATATDNCAISSISATRSDGLPLAAAYPVGSTLITWKAVDVHGNSATAQQRITIVDAEAPAIIVPPPIATDFAGEAGSAVTYAVSSRDNCGVKTVVCTPASGAMFPIGNTIAACVATDVNGNSASASFEVYVRGARGVKTNVRDELIALRTAATEDADIRGLDTAIDRLGAALDPAAWRDETHVDAGHGDRVFHDEKDAVNALRNLAKDARSRIDAAVLNRAIARIVACDRLLARVATTEAIDAANVAKAESEIAKGDAARDSDHPGVAIEHYRNAWLHVAKK